MSKTSVLQLVSDLGRDRAEPDTCERYYEDIAYELAKQGQITDAAVVEASVNDDSFPFPESAIDILAVFYDGTQLMRSGRQAIEWKDRGWRDRRGKPQTYVVEDELVRTFRLYPRPDAATKFLGFDQQWGVHMPPYAVVVFYTQKREDLPEYFDLYIACEILSREFKRESDHRDLPFSEAAEQLARLFYQMATHTS